jgi:uncharacterized membrane protein
MSAKGGSVAVVTFGYLILAMGIVNVVFDLHRRTEWALPTDMGLAVAEGAFILLGLVALSIGQCLRRLEKRLDEIEAKQRVGRISEV